MRLRAVKVTSMTTQRPIRPKWTAEIGRMASAAANKIERAHLMYREGRYEEALGFYTEARDKELCVKGESPLRSAFLLLRCSCSRLLPQPCSRRRMQLLLKRKKWTRRLKYLASIENAYPHKFNVTMSDQTYLETFKGLENGEHKEDITVSLAGQIMSKRSSSSKLFFYDLNATPGGWKVQVMADARKN